MNSTTKQAFDLSADDVKLAVAEFIERKFGNGSPITVSVSVEHVCTGYGMNEYDQHLVSVKATREVK